MAEKMLTTTVSIPVDLYEWCKKHDHKLRSLMVAGKEHLSGAPDRAALEHNIIQLRMEISRLLRYRDMVLWAFHNDPEAYNKMHRYVWEMMEDEKKVSK